MRKLYAATVVMQSVVGNVVNTRPVLSVRWAESLGQAEREARNDASDAVPNMQAVDAKAVQVPDDVIRTAATELP